MDNDDEMTGTILSRRDALSYVTRASLGVALGSGLLTIAEASYQQRALRDVKLIASPALTEGPFFVDEKLNRSNLIAATSRPSVAQAQPLALSLKVLELKQGLFQPLSGVMVDIWQADAIGAYSDESNPMNSEYTLHQQWLRGYQTSDGNGFVKFLTIIPGWYNGRTAHIHFKIRVPGDRHHREFTSQLFFADEFADRIFEHSPYLQRSENDARNTNDNIFCEHQLDGSLAGEHLTLSPIPHPEGKGYRADFTIALTDHSFAERRNFGFGPPPSERL